ncbi:MAG: DivIVA domain-containing protein [Paenibacillaceae bacterium]|nr:DivIVA domain-containing protein [Paenibacillaceae bacterium]
MRLTPLDIHDKEFTKSFKGYNENEVDEFLDVIIQQYEQLYTVIIDCFRVMSEQEEDMRKLAAAKEPVSFNAPSQVQLDAILRRLRKVEIHCWGSIQE